MTQPFLSVTQASQSILESLSMLPDAHSVPIWEALNRVLAKDILSPIDVPAHDNSAMDGYALNSADINTKGSTRLSVVGTVKAGTPFGKTVEQGQCVRIMTG
ncbi:MAG: molybdopterin molybdenumtransferase MoeA, partial [Limnobacter sp.]|nr:molybdopterin molybdenumtransferase MoeA [Limnobacter sp.]